jgi:hypothetical protein
MRRPRRWRARRAGQAEREMAKRQIYRRCHGRWHRLTLLVRRNCRRKPCTGVVHQRSVLNTVPAKPANAAIAGPGLQRSSTVWRRTETVAGRKDERITSCQCALAIDFRREYVSQK